MVISKKEYEKPSLKKFGQVTSITQAAGSGVPDNLDIPPDTAPLSP